MTVKQKQALLLILGYYVGEVDGDWGTLSKTACKAFQQDHGLKDDGVFGSDTEKAVLAAVAKNEVKETTFDKTGDFWDEIVYFDKYEFACKCGCGSDEMNETLIRVADRTRAHFGSPITVSSGRRCASHNARVGGVSNSRHIANPGKAMDFCVKGKSSTTVLAYVQQQPEIRYAYAIDGSYVHMDIE